MPPKRKDLKQLRCFDCKRIFCCIECRKKHERNTHLINPTCAICEGKPLLLLREFQAAGWLISHIEHVHLPLYCKRCNKVFNNLNDLSGRNYCRVLGQQNLLSPMINMNLANAKTIGNSSLRVQTPDFGGSLQINQLKRSLSDNSSERIHRSALHTRLLTTSTPMAHNANKKYFSPMGSQVSDINSPNSALNSPVLKFENAQLFTPSYEETNKKIELKSISLIKGLHRKGAMKKKITVSSALHLSTPNNNSDDKLTESNGTNSKPKVTFAVTPSIIIENEETLGSRSSKLNFTPKNPFKSSTRFEVLRKQHEITDKGKNFGAISKKIEDDNTDTWSPIMNYDFENNEQNAKSFGEKYLNNNCNKDGSEKMVTSMIEGPTYEEESLDKSVFVEELYLTANYGNKSSFDIWHSPHSTTESLLKELNTESNMASTPLQQTDTGFKETDATSLVLSETNENDDKNCGGIWSSVAHAVRSAFNGFQTLSVAKQSDQNGKEKSPNKKTGISKHIANMILLRRTSTGKRRRSASFHALDQSPVSKRIRGEQIRGRRPIARMRKLDKSFDTQK